MIKSIKLSMFIILSLLVMSTVACSSQNSTVNKESTPSTEDSVKKETVNFGSKGAKEDQALTLEKMLTYAIQDEYLAHAEYDYILKNFGDQRPFSNIIKAEEKHIELLKPLFEKYNVSLPDNTANNYLVHPKSIEEALKTGVQSEIDNIAMYESFLKEKLPEDIKSVFVELRDASKNHLSAFENSLKK